MGYLPRHAIALAIVAVTTGVHVTIHRAHERAGRMHPTQDVLNIPSRIGPYEQIGPDLEVGDRVREILGTSLVMMRTYRAPNGRSIVLTIVYAGATRRSLHFPEVCLVGAGWEINKQYTDPVGFDFTGKRLVLTKNASEEAVLYWFKTGDHMTGNFFENSYHWVWNQITLGAPTSSMIKLSAQISGQNEEAVFGSLEDFAVKLKPILERNVK